MNIVLPAPRNRSVTAAEELSEVKDKTIYSAGVLAHGGQGVLTIFTQPIGASIPELTSATATANAHQTKYGLGTTSLEKAGELGDGEGDVAARSIGITFEQAAYTASTGAPRSFGMTDFEVKDTLAKVAVEFKIANSVQLRSPAIFIPSHGRVGGVISTTGNAATVATSQNGAGEGRKLYVPIQIDRRATLKCELSTTNASSLAYSVTTSDGQPSLVWCSLHVYMAADLRGV